MELYIGLMSGTSVDGIDAALVDFSSSLPKLITTHYVPYEQPLRKKILSLCQPGENEIERLGELDTLLGDAFAYTVNDLLQKHSISAKYIKAIGSHGQTIRHVPHHRFTLQIGDPNIIAAKTGITTVADFRRRDMALGGQGAPLVPAFHQSVFSSDKVNRAIVNIGGIANVTLLSQSHDAVIGFDTGPGNVLMDSWIDLHQHQSHDQDGAWGAKGMVHPTLLECMLNDPYFQRPAPKSSGREYFNLAWIEKNLQAIKKEIQSVDVQATLTELTAQSILNAIQYYISQGEILVCGGGAHNTLLMQRLQHLAQTNFMVASTAKYDIDPNWVEATAFAWLARQTLHQQSGNLPSVTGATHPTILGGVYHAIGG